MEIWQILLLAVVQGVTEFLPVSSSGHLTLLQHALGIKEAQLLLAVVLHAGTLLSILVYYYKDMLIFARFQQRQTSLRVIVATIPIVVVGLGFGDLIEKLFVNYWVSVAGLCITAFILLVVHRDRKDGTVLSEMTWKQAILTGIAQCVAIMPGVSRSGTTIATAGRLGTSPTAAASFSFFLAVPAILGATLLQLLKWLKSEDSIAQPGLLLLGFAVSFVVGYASLRFLIHLLKRGQFRHFGYYCLFVALLASIIKVVNPS